MILGLSWDNLELRTYPRDKYDDKCEVRDYPGMILNEKNDFTFWIRYGISTNFGIIVLDYPKSEVTHCIFLSFNALGELCVCVHCGFYCTGTLLCNLAAIPYSINIIIIMVIENACNDRISDSTNSATSSFSAGTAPRTTLRGACDAPPNHIIGCCPLLVF